ncbi:MAG: cysteine desulfurase family protein [bacterium]|nr:cysteine desulfurase family protein [bacterium]
MQAYLDNSATTRCFDSVRETMSVIMDQTFGNPSSMHMVGIEAENQVKKAKKIIADTLKVTEQEIFFTSGGTESDNLALIGCAMANKRAGMHLITSRIEHPAILETMKYLSDQGFRITYLDTDQYGRVRLDQLEESVTDETILVSIMHVNNEIGSLQPLEEIAKLIHEKNPKALFHVDGVQGFGKYRVYPKRMGIDLYSISGHKIHGPKGMGVLYINSKVKIHPIIFGGGQQKGIRSGTENVPGIAGLGQATQEIYTDFEMKMDRLYHQKQFFVSELLKLDGVTVNGIETIAAEQGTGLAVTEEAVHATAPHVISASFNGIRSEVLLHSLEDKGIYVSAGSACASNKPAVSETLKAIGLDKSLLDSTIRFSMSVETTTEELEYTLETLQELLPVLRKYTRH